jgi:putative flippase GtrA
VNRGFVFRGKGRVAAELPRYLAAFAASFVVNLVVLHLCTSRLHMAPLAAQVAAIMAYIVVMFSLCQLFVFRPRGS